MAEGSQLNPSPRIQVNAVFSQVRTLSTQIFHI
jgi:hypothetical protein